MRRARDRRLSWPIGGFAALGIYASHVIAYRVTAPDPHHRAELLTSTGHSAWDVVGALVGGLLMASLARYVATSWSRRGSGSASILPRFLPSWISLSLFQVGGYVLLEAVERWAAGDFTSPDLLLEPAVLIGIAVQVLVAIPGAALLVAVCRVVDSVIARRAGLPTASSSSLLSRLPRDAGVLRQLVELCSRSSRGPPSPLGIGLS